MPGFPGLPADPLGDVDLLSTADNTFRAILASLRAYGVTVLSGPADSRPAASTATTGYVYVTTDTNPRQVSFNVGTAWIGPFVVGNDGRLSDARSPTAHADRHTPGGSDSLYTVQETVTPNNGFTYVFKTQAPNTIYEYFIVIQREANATFEQVWRVIFSNFGTRQIDVKSLGASASFPPTATFGEQAVGSDRQLFIQAQTPSSGFPYRARISSRLVLKTS